MPSPYRAVPPARVRTGWYLPTLSVWVAGVLLAGLAALLGFPLSPIERDIVVECRSGYDCVETVYGLGLPNTPRPDCTEEIARLTAPSVWVDRTYWDYRTSDHAGPAQVRATFAWCGVATPRTVALGEGDAFQEHYSRVTVHESTRALNALLGGFLALLAIALLLTLRVVRIAIDPSARTFIVRERRWPRRPATIALSLDDVTDIVLEASGPAIATKHTRPIAISSSDRRLKDQQERTVWRLQDLLAEVRREE